MEPANILFIIAFIGLPIAFGIWAIMSRRELLRQSPPPLSEEAEPDQRTLPADQEQASPDQDVQGQRTERLPQVEERDETRQLPPERPVEQQTVKVFGVQPTPPPEAPAASPEPEPERRRTGQSGTTEELPIIGNPDSAHPSAQIHPPPNANPPVNRPFYPPRYAGRSGGVVKRLSPLESQRFLAPKPSGRR
jgi:hypothetical protein